MIRRHALALGALGALAGAWGPEGHERLNRVAEGLLHGKHRDQIRTMMHSDVIDVATYEQTMTKQYPETEPLHWHRQQPEWACGDKGGLGDKGHIRCDGHGAENGSLFCALAYFFEHFAHDALLNEFPQPLEPIGTPETLPSLLKVPDSDKTPAQFLRWLVILVGDLHQPLHWLHEHSHGRDIMLRYKDEEYTLLDFWESYIPSHLQSLEGQVHPDMTDKEYVDRSGAWEHKLPTELFREWAKEAAEKVCSQVYAPMTVNHADGTRVDSPFTLDDELFEKWASLAEDLTNLGGERLAFILNEIIEHKRHKEAEEDGRGLPGRIVAIGMERQSSDEDEGPPVPGPASAPKKRVDKFTAGIDAEEEKEEEEEAEPDDPDADADDDNTEEESDDSADAAKRPKRKKASDWSRKDFIKRLKVVERRRSRHNLYTNLGLASVVVPLTLGLLTWHRFTGGIRITAHLKV